MNRLERYLQAIRKYLPWQRQDDILAELRANLESQLEDKEAELGRPLTDAEIEAWLKQFGPPMQVAARYAPQQYLIGPSIFPIYWYILRLACMWCLAVYFAANAVILVVSNPTWDAITKVALGAPGVVVMTGAWITLFFAALEYASTHYPGEWLSTVTTSVDALPEKLSSLEFDRPTPRKPRSYPIAVAGIVFGFVFLIWLLLVPIHPVLMFGPGWNYMRISPFQPAPILYPVYWSIVALNVIQLAWHCVDLLRGAWRYPNHIEQLVSKGLGLIPVGLLITAPGHLYVSLKDPVADGAHYGALVDQINYGVHLGMMFVCAIVVIQLLWELGRTAFEAYREREASIR